MNFVRLWFLGLINPSGMLNELKDKPAPVWGVWAVLIRFLVTSLTSILALYLLDRLPFAPSRLTFLPVADYYKAEIFFLPLWGLGIWLLMSGMAHVVIRLFGKISDFDQILNIIGMGMLVPMPVLWLFDWATIASGWYGMIAQATSHSLIQLWETGIEALGLKRILGLRLSGAVALAAVINVVYVLLAIIFIR